MKTLSELVLRKNYLNVRPPNVKSGSLRVHGCKFVCVCVCVPKIEKSDVSIAIYVVKMIVFNKFKQNTRSVNVRHRNVTM